MLDRVASAFLCLAAGTTGLSCHDTLSASGDVARGDGAADHDGDGAGGQDPALGDADGHETGADAAPIGGPLTYVIDGVSPLLDRDCDFDGDALGDNAIADLGPALGAVFAAGMSSMVHNPLADGRYVAFHFPWVDDLGRLDAADRPLIFLEGHDTDDPWDHSDAFSGTEPLYAMPWSLDGCGEPLYVFLSVHLDGGELTGRPGLAVLPMGADIMTLSEASVDGTLSGLGRSATLTVCGYITSRELGEIYQPDSGPLSPLEALVAGGIAVGVDTPGLSPDVDLDGDGEERYRVDEDGRMTTCIDGDGTSIEGRDCWQDARMADAFAFVFELRAVPALFAGREPGWDRDFEVLCENPPEHSLWEPS